MTGSVVGRIEDYILLSSGWSGTSSGVRSSSSSTAGSVSSGTSTTSSITGSAAGAAAKAKISAYELQTLSYTASDVVASLASGISPLTILLQQGGQVFDAFGGASARENGLNLPMLG